MSDAEPVEIAEEVEGGPVRLASQIRVANSFGSRLKGLIGSSLTEDEALLISPCSSVHTFGMSYPIDIVFLDEDSRAIEIHHELKPWRATRWVPGARGVLELSAGTLAGRGFHKGQKVEVPPLVEAPAPREFWSNLSLSAFWLFLAIYMIPRMAAGEMGPSGFVLFAVNSLVAVLFLTRRKEIRVTDSPRDRLITLVCILLSFSLRPTPEHSLVSPGVESTLLTVSSILVLLAYLSLGRSFGLIPADRGIKFKGMYEWVRHPLYGAEMLFFLSFLLANFTHRNVVFLLGIFLSLHLRALAEERLLARDPAYESYCRKIRKRYIPYLI